MDVCGAIADDLTGAVDAGLQRFNKGAAVRIALDCSEAENALCGEEAFVIVNTQSRNVAGAQAYQSVQAAMRMCVKSGCRILYKKIDSTLRGHLGAEIKAVLDGGGFDCAIVAPALPYLKRTTVGGVHYVNGVKVCETELAEDPFSPVRRSAVADIIGEEFQTKTALLGIDTVRKGGKAAGEFIKEAVRHNIRVIVADAQQDADLQSIARGAGQSGVKSILCGSAGLFEYIDDAYLIKHTAAQNIAQAPFPGPALVLSGSPAAMSKRQIAVLAENYRDVRVIRFDVRSVTPQSFAEASARAAGEAAGYLAAGCHVVLDAAGEGKKQIANRIGSDKKQLDAESALILRLLCDTAAAVRVPLAGLVLYGGDTAAAVLRHLGAKGIEITKQIEPYIPQGKLIGGKCSGIPVVTKAGGFGNDKTLVNIIHSLTAKE